GEVSRGWLGVAIQTVEPDLAEALGIDEETDGVLVSDVEPESPAAEAGLERGDVITAIDGDAVESASELRNRVGIQSPDTNVELDVLRGDETEQLEVTLGEMPGARTPQAHNGETPEALQGLELRQLDNEIRDQLDVPPQIEQGVAVEDVEPNSPADRLGLRPGDIIIELNRRPIESPADLAEGFERAGDRILLLVFRDGNTLFLAGRKR
ncbi:MAG: PDZ domain-containing protein, partial [Persicimonas sp.]